MQNFLAEVFSEATDHKLIYVHTGFTSLLITKSESLLVIALHLVLRDCDLMHMPTSHEDTSYDSHGCWLTAPLYQRMMPTSQKDHLSTLKRIQNFLKKRWPS